MRLGLVLENRSARNNCTVHTHQLNDLLVKLASCIVTVRVMASHLRFNPEAAASKTTRAASEHHAHATHGSACKARRDFHVDVMNNITHYALREHVTQCSNGTEIYST